MKCPDCDGSGFIQTDVDDGYDCETCGASGLVKGGEDEVVSVAIDLNLTDLKQAAIERAVRRLMTDHHDGLRSKVAKEVRAHVTPLIEAEVATIVREELGKEFRPRNQWGEASGDPVTLRGMIARKIEDFVAKPTRTDSYGKVKSHGLSGLVDAIVAERWKTEVKGHADKVVKDIQSGLRAKLTAEITKAVAKLLKDPARGA